MQPHTNREIHLHTQETRLDTGFYLTRINLGHGSDLACGPPVDEVQYDLRLLVWMLFVESFHYLSLWMESLCKKEILLWRSLDRGHRVFSSGKCFFCQLTIVENEAVPVVRPFTFQLSCNVVFLMYSVWLDLLQTSSPLQWSWGVLWLLLGAMCPVFCLFGFFCFQGKTCFILGNIWSSAHCRR